ncbi:von Willebrand factor A domain-containing protein 5A [Sparganum proliferum]
MAHSAGTFGLKYWSPMRDVPLQSARVNTTVINATANVDCTFAFQSESKERLETVFSLPIGSDASVYHFEAKIGDRRLICKWRDRSENQRTYQQAMEEAYSPFLVHKTDFMGDIFSMEIGNIPPNESILLNLKYVTPLAVREVDPEAERFKDLQVSSALVFTLPFVLNDRAGERRGCGQRQSDASTSPDLINTSANCKVKFTGIIFGNSPILAVTSPAEQTFVVKFTTEDKLSATVRLASPFTFDSNLEMEIAFADPHLMISYEPAVDNAEAETGDFLTFFDCITANFLPQFPPREERASGSRREIVFLIDRSQCMTGESMQLTKRALLIFLESLPSDCRFQIVGFGSTHEALFPEPLDCNEESLERALVYQEAMEANMGGYRIVPALKAIYAVPLTGAGWSRQIIFLTCGDSEVRSDVSSLIRGHSADSRFFVIGLCVNRGTSVVGALARSGQGKAVFVRDPDKLSAAVMDILHCALRDPATEVSISWHIQSPTSSSPLEVLTVPLHLPPICYGTYFTVFGLVENPYRQKLTGSATLTFNQNGQMHCLRAVLSQPSFSTSAFSYSPLHRQAAKTRIIELMDQYIDLFDYWESYETKKQILRRMISLSLAANVSSSYTYFVGMDLDRTATCYSPLTLNRLRRLNCLEARAKTCFSFDLEAVPTSPKSNNTVSSIMPSAECRRDPSPPPSPLATAAAAEEDIFATIADLQEFVGCWSLSARLSRLLNCSRTALTATIPPKYSGEDGRIWATALVLVLLEVKIPWRSAEWRPIAKEGRSWLAKHLPRKKAPGGERGGEKNRSLDELRSLAKTTLTSLIPFP